MSLIFYDTETTGTDSFFDQILEFAAIHTDDELKELDRIEIKCRLLPHIVPSPTAMMLTGLDVERFTDSSLPSHYEMVRRIGNKLHSWSPGLFLGWNSIDFDELFLRQALYKTLHNPYLTSMAGNGRLDAKVMAQACHLFAPDSITFPSDDGQLTFRLAEMASANGCLNHRPHDATSDVEATIFLSRLIKESAPDVWSSFMRFSRKTAVKDYIEAESLFCLSDYVKGRPYSWIVTSIGANESNLNEYYVYNLEIDPDILRLMSNKELIERLDTVPRPIKRLRCNAMPILCIPEDAPSICHGRDLDNEELVRRADLLQNDADFRRRLVNAFEASAMSFATSPHVERKIYEGFYSEAATNLMARFHNADWEGRAAMIELFPDNRLKTLGRRLLYTERPDLLSLVARRALEVEMGRRLIGLDQDSPWLTIPRAVAQVEQLKAEMTGSSLARLLKYAEFLSSLRSMAISMLREESTVLTA